MITFDNPLVLRSQHEASHISNVMTWTDLDPSGKQRHVVEVCYASISHLLKDYYPPMKQKNSQKPPAHIKHKKIKLIN